MKQWYAVYTKSSSEKKVASQLAKKGIDAYVPVVLTAKGWSNEKGNYKPLFESIVFVAIEEKLLNTILQVSGIISIFHWLNMPATISSEEIALLRKFLAENICIDIERIKIGRENSGPKKGELLLLTEEHTQLCLPSIGYLLLGQPAFRQQIETSRKLPSYTFIS
ncbi:MAG: hypothetical protein EOP48_02010 [Sphingobacteriales bacterium]|nr:MAG: hypothetical protein EOP48_02010 [Sphingobacteriales bacterium]